MARSGHRRHPQPARRHREGGQEACQTWRARLLLGDRRLRLQNIYRRLTALGHSCMVLATHMIPRKPGERIKTARRDSQKLAILHRSGDLTGVWVSDSTHESHRDLVRARVNASIHLMRGRQQLLAFFLPPYGRSYSTGRRLHQEMPCARSRLQPGLGRRDAGARTSDRRARQAGEPALGQRTNTRRESAREEKVPQPPIRDVCKDCNSKWLPRARAEHSTIATQDLPSGRSLHCT